MIHINMHVYLCYILGIDENRSRESYVIDWLHIYTYTSVHIYNEGNVISKLAENV